MKTILALILTLTTFNAIASNKPHNVVIHVDSKGLKTQKLALNAADNLQRLYEKENINVEIVACGPGLSLVSTNARFYKKRIKHMIKNGIRFSAGFDHSDKQSMRDSNTTIKLQPGVVEVQGCLMRIVTLQENGYAYMKP